jgi:hypothetical protein
MGPGDISLSMRGRPVCYFGGWLAWAELPLRDHEDQNATAHSAYWTTPRQAPVSRPRDSMNSLKRSKSFFTRNDTAPV